MQTLQNNKKIIRQIFILQISILRENMIIDRFHAVV